jgi:hypothetical protein
MTFLPVSYVLPNRLNDNEDYGGIRTHSRYIVNIYALLRDNPELTFNVNRQNNYGQPQDLTRILKKLDIVKYTLGSIKTEERFSAQDDDFLPLSLSWLWIKGYYATFHLLSLLISLEKSDFRYMFDRGFNDHSRIMGISNQLITSNNPFNISELNTSFNGTTLEAFRSARSINLRNTPTFNPGLYELSLRKVYKDERAKLKGLASAQKIVQITRLNSNIFTIFNLFHNYRERFNYSGFQYLDCNGDLYMQIELKRFYDSSYKVIISVSKAIVSYLCNFTENELNGKLVEINQLL